MTVPGGNTLPSWPLRQTKPLRLYLLSLDRLAARLEATRLVPLRQPHSVQTTCRTPHPRSIHARTSRLPPIPTQIPPPTLQSPLGNLHLSGLRFDHSLPLAHDLLDRGRTAKSSVRIATRTAQGQPCFRLRPPPPCRGHYQRPTRLLYRHYNHHLRWMDLQTPVTPRRVHQTEVGS